MPRQETPDFKKLDNRTCTMCDHRISCDGFKESVRFINREYDVEHHTKENPTILYDWNDLAKICNFFRYKTGSKAEELATK